MPQSSSSNKPITNGVLLIITDGVLKTMGGAPRTTDGDQGDIDRG